MDIVKFFADQVDKWNIEEKCGFCWNFGAPLVQSEIEKQQLPPDKPCCMNLFLTNIRFSDRVTRNPVTNLVVSSWCDWNFTLWVITPEPLGTNNYNEILGHPVEESKWVKIFQPIQECLGCGSLMDFCTLLGYDVNINSRNGEIVHNYGGQSYNGWRINFTFSVRTDLITKPRP